MLFHTRYLPAISSIDPIAWLALWEFFSPSLESRVPRIIPTLLQHDAVHIVNDRNNTRGYCRLRYVDRRRRYQKVGHKERWRERHPNDDTADARWMEERIKNFHGTRHCSLILIRRWSTSGYLVSQLLTDRIVRTFLKFFFFFSGRCILYYSKFLSVHTRYSTVCGMSRELNEKLQTTERKLTCKSVTVALWHNVYHRWIVSSERSKRASNIRDAVCRLEVSTPSGSTRRNINKYGINSFLSSFLNRMDSHPPSRMTPHGPNCRRRRGFDLEERGKQVEEMEKRRGKDEKVDGERRRFHGDQWDPDPALNSRKYVRSF